MSQKQIAIRISELKTARVICKHPGCGAVVESPVDRLATFFQGNPVNCRFCQRALCVSKDIHTWTNFLILAHVVSEAANPDAKFDIEFVLPAD